MKGIKNIVYKIFTLRTLLELCIGLLLLNPVSNVVRMIFALAIFGTIIIMLCNETDKICTEES